MRRIQGFEFNDSPWAPEVLREVIVDSLSNALEWGDILEGMVDPFIEFLDRARCEQVLDIGSGAGGPAKILASAFSARGRSLKMVMSDLFPRPDRWAPLVATHPNLGFSEAPVDATRVPRELAATHARSFINILHHLPPPVAARVLGGAVADRAPFFVAEGFPRDPLRFLIPFAPFGLPALWMSPWLAEKNRLARALIAYSPVGVLASLWDGTVSSLRVYSEDELRAMIPRDASYVLTTGVYRWVPYGLGTYFYGIPKERLDQT